MTSAGTYLEANDLDRRAVLKRVLIGSGVAAAALAAPGFTGVAKADGGGKKIALDVDLDGFADFQGPAAVDGNGAFYVSGDISAHGSGRRTIGTFRCWGYVAENGDGVVNQEFLIDGRGNIQISGVESGAARAVTGGTGEFSNARGEGMPDISDFDSGRFSIVFRLTD